MALGIVGMVAVAKVKDWHCTQRSLVVGGWVAVVVRGHHSANACSNSAATAAMRVTMMHHGRVAVQAAKKGPGCNSRRRRPLRRKPALALPVSAPPPQLPLPSTSTGTLTVASVSLVMVVKKMDETSSNPQPAVQSAAARSPPAPHRSLRVSVEASSSNHQACPGQQRL